MPHHQRQHQGVVGAQKTFQEHQHGDVPGDQGKVSAIRAHHEALTSGGLCVCALGRACSSVVGIGGPGEFAWIAEQRRKYLYHNREAGATARPSRPTRHDTRFRRQAD